MVLLKKKFFNKKKIMAVEKRKGTRHEVLDMEINLITFLLINKAP